MAKHAKKPLKAKTKATSRKSVEWRRMEGRCAKHR